MRSTLVGLYWFVAALVALVGVWAASVILIDMLIWDGDE